MEPSEGYKLLAEGAARFGVTVTEEQWSRFYDYMRLLQDYNNRVNLTAIKEDPAIITKHFVDCLSIAPFIQTGGKTKTLCDIGTGAGFPGIPLKIAKPELRLILVDSLNKRLLFLEEVVRKLGLENVELVHMRAEDFGRDPSFRDSIDYSTARAVAPMNTLLELSTPPLKPGGMFIAMKGGRDEGSFESAASKLALTLDRTERFSIDVFDDDGTESAAERIVYIFKKVKPTPKAFPRKAGTPSKEPL